MNHGAMDVLISNNVKATTSQKVKDILHMYHIKSYTSEPHHQHQTYTECCIGHIKDVMNWVLSFTGAPTILRYYVLCILCTSSISLPIVSEIFPLTNIYMVKPWIFPPCFVSISKSQSTILILILLLLPL